MNQPIESLKGYNIAAIHRHYGNFILDCIRLSGVLSIDDALDIRQNIYIKLFERSIRSKIPNGQGLAGYIRRATRNAVIDYKRSQKREKILFDWIIDGKRDIVGRKMDEAALKRWLSENYGLEAKILKAIHFLNEYSPRPDVSMTAIISDVYDGKTATEIAERFNTKPGTVYSWISRFRDDLLVHLGMR